MNRLHFQKQGVDKFLIRNFKGDNYRTPRWLKNIFRNWYDPCPLNSTPKFDGLKTNWLSKTYVNPPYSNPLPWVKKAVEESKKGKTIVMLLRLDSSTEWYKILVENKAHFLWLNERIRFANNSPSNFPSMLVILK